MTAGELAAQLDRSAKSVEREFQRTAERLARDTESFCKARLREEIYAIPEDVSPTGRKKWERRHILLDNEHSVVVDPFTVEVRNATPYAEVRHEAGKPGRRAINPRRVSHWRDELLEAFEPLTAELYDYTIRVILGEP